MRFLSTITAVTLTVASQLSGQSAQAVLRPHPSGRALSEVVLAYPQGQAPVGATNLSIKIDYGVPHLRGRTLHTGDVVPYDVPWRTGANALTTLTTGADLKIGGVAVPKGPYVVFTLPSRQGWKLILQRSVGQSPTAYDAANDVVRIDLRHTTLQHPIESLTIWLIPSTAADAARGELRLAWGTAQLSTDWIVTP
jgi:hypothetical protein